MDATSDWFWEGNVVEAVARHLLTQGWQILQRADTLSKERGVDLYATKAGLALLVEVKGYPSKQYRDPRRAGELKSTNPTNQAQHWYSHALLKALRLQSSDPKAVVALAFPDFPRFRALHSETRTGLERLSIVIMFVTESGEVQTFGM